MPTAYFDTSMYDHIAKGLMPRDEVEAVARAVVRRELVVYQSTANIDELLGQWQTSRAEVLLRLRVMRNTVGFSQMLKQPADLFREAVLAYATGQKPPAVMLPEREQALMSEFLYRILDRDEELDHVVAQVNTRVGALKDPFPKWWGAARAETHSALKWDTIPVSDRRRVNFKEFFASGAAGWAEDFAESLGVADACRERGIDGFLALRPVRLCIGASMSLVFTTTFGDGLQSRLPQRGDGYDIWHAISASAADFFVTGDERLAQQVEQVPVDGFCVLRSLRQLLERLGGLALARSH